MSKARYPHRLKDLGAFAAALALATFVAACGPQETTTSPTDETSTDTADAGWTVTPVAPEPSEAEAPVQVTSESTESKRNDSKTSDERWLEWFAAREKLRAAEEPDADEEAALEKTEKELAENHPPQDITDALQLVAFHWDMTGAAEPADGTNAEFQVSWLFRKTAEISVEPDHRIELIVRGTPDKDHQHLLATESEPDRSRFSLQYTVTGNLKSTEPGEYFLITKKTVLPAVPYDMETFLVEQAQQEDGSWKWVAAFGERIDLGWRADAED